MASVYLKPGKEKRVLSGHPWVFASDIDHADRSSATGNVVSVFSKKGTFLARAVYNPHSQISLRVLSHQDETIDAVFIRNRIQRAIDYRRQFADLQSCRLIHAEADGLPAVIVDSFGPVLSMQCLSLGMSRFEQVMVDTLVDLLSPMGIYERNDVSVRLLEGMEQSTGVLYGEVPDRVEMQENGIRFWVDVKAGQKTGFFLDQKENRAALKPFCPGAKVLDCFCHNGSFALNAARYGAERFVNISTDKAVYPKNIMGASKRAAEILVSQANGNGTRYVAVRFGNVLGSNGSVVPIFQDQIKHGGPIKVTHPEVTRFFMTIPEAVELVLQSLTIGEGGEVFVLDMGEPVRIVDLAKNMIRLSGLVEGDDIQIEYTGLRPGEKMHEILNDQQEHLLPTAIPKVNVLRADALPRVENLDEILSDMHVAIKNRDDQQARALLWKMVNPTNGCPFLEPDEGITIISETLGINGEGV